MKRKTGKKLLGVLLTLAMVIGLMPGMSLTAYADYAVIWTEDQTIIWDKTIDGGVAVSTDAGIKLTIAEGKTLTVNGGITAGTRTLTVEGKGTLVVNGADQNTVGTTGNKGADGHDGTYAQNCGGAGENGGNGAGGGVGIEGNLVVNGVTVIVTGGTGGKGGKGGDGGNGYGGGQGEERRPGGSGGTGGTGGAGGVGIKGSVTVNSGSITVTGGKGGKGGDGGAAGQNGQGSFPPENNPTAGGNGQDGSSGQAVSGTITENEDAQESDDGSTWTAISGTTSAKRYVKVAHLHSFIYSASGATITAKCGKTGCDLTANPTLTIVAPTLTTYGGTGSEAATLTGLSDFNSATGKNIAATDIKYVGRNGTNYAESGTAPTNAGKYTAKITVEEKTASVDYEIDKAKPTTPTGLNAKYGQTLADVTLPAGWTWADSTQSVGEIVSPAASFKANFAGDDNYNAASNEDVTVNVGIADNPMTYAETQTVTKAFSISSQTATLEAAENGVGELSYGITSQKKGEDTVNYFTLDGTTLTIAANTSVGTYTLVVYARAAGNGNYFSVIKESTVTVTVEKVAPTVTAPTTKTLIYTGSAQELVNAGSTNDGTLYYAVTTENTAPTDASLYTTSIPSKTDAGTYYVWYKVVGDSGHADTMPASVPVTISPKAMTVSATGYTGYPDGKAHGITVTVTDPATGATVKYGEAQGTYNLDASPTLTEAGTKTVYYQVTADNYTTATGSATVTIGKIVYTAVKTSATVDEHTIGSGEDAVLVFQRSVDDEKTITHFTSAAVDGKTLSTGDYSVKSGSLILTLKASYLDTLTPGTHQVTATFDDGSADTTITILEAPATTDVPKTGDGADLGLWLTLMLAGLLLLGGWAVVTIRKRS